MDTAEIIKKICKDKGIPVSQVETDLGYGNGSISKSKNMSADRAFQIAKYLGVSVEYLMTGKEVAEINDEMSYLRQQQSILLEISRLSQEITKLYKSIDMMQSNIAGLQQEYNQIEIEKNKLYKKDTIEEEQPLTKKVTPVPFDGQFHLPFTFTDSMYSDDSNEQQ
jgi:transcriptional regulator with XRE-family HTH domain